MDTKKYGNSAVNKGESFMEINGDSLIAYTHAQRKDIEKMVGIYKSIPDEKKELLTMLIFSYMEGIKAGSGFISEDMEGVGVNRVIS